MRGISSSAIALVLACASSGAFAAPEGRIASPPPGKARCTIDASERAVLVGTVNPGVRTLLARYMAGGDGLTEQVVGLLRQDPASAADVVAVAATASPEQRIAIARAIVDVLAHSPPESATVREIRSALRCADPNTRATIAYLENRLYAQSPDGDGRRGPMWIEGVSGFGGGGGFVHPPGPHPSPN